MRGKKWQMFSPYCWIVCGFIILILNLEFIYLVISEDNPFLCFATQKNSLHQRLPDSSEWASHPQSHLLPCPLHSQQLWKPGRWKKGEVCTINHLAALLFAVLCHSLPLCYYLKGVWQQYWGLCAPTLGCRGRLRLPPSPFLDPAFRGCSVLRVQCACVWRDWVSKGYILVQRGLKYLPRLLLL